MEEGILLANRVTIQDIADVLGVSRNTVSKALNNTGVLAESTKVRILQKAAEMGYGQFPISEGTSLFGKGREIALFTTAVLDTSHFGSVMLDYFQNEIAKLGYRFAIYLVRENEIKSKALPTTFHKENVDGILCVELFDREYSQLVCEIGLPTLFVDAPANLDSLSLKADVLLMNSSSNIYHFIQEMTRRGKTSFGFIGEYQHCQSFYERFYAYKHALDALHLPPKDEFCILGNDAKFTYTDYLHDQLNKMQALPQVFLCANDFVAIDFLRVLREKGIRVPQDVYLCGFDDSSESRILSPSLTTIHIYSEIMGFSAVHLLISRIKNPSLNYRVLYTETTLKYRESTGDTFDKDTVK
jgi:LacI family transcriptional regulator